MKYLRMSTGLNPTIVPVRYLQRKLEREQVRQNNAVFDLVNHDTVRLVIVYL